MTIRGKLASQSALIFGVRIFGAGLVFLAQAAIARLWGQNTLGEYLIIMAAVNLIAVAMPLGFHTIATYFAAEYKARGQRELLWRFLLRSYGHVAIMAALMFGLGGPVLHFIGAPGEVLSHYWTETALMATAMALVIVDANVLVGLKRPFAGLFADGLFRPILLLGGFALVLGFSHGGPALGPFLLWFGVCFLAVALVHLAITVWTVGRVERQEGGPAQREGARWWRFAVPWVVIALATDFFFDIDLLVLSGPLGKADLAIFGVIARLFALTSFGVAAVYAVTMPDIFEAEAKGGRAAFVRKIGDANLVATGISAALFAGVGLAGPIVLLLFGPSFLSGAGPLMILCLGLIVRSVFGPASVVLSIHDRPYASLPAVAIGLGSLVAGNWLLVPAYGLMGAAVAALCAFTLWSASLWFIARRITGLDVSILPRIREWRAGRTKAA